MTDLDIKKLADAWANKDSESILRISKTLEKNGFICEAKILYAFSLSVSGRLKEALDVYSGIKDTPNQKLLKYLFEVDFAYCAMKLKRNSVRTTVFARIKMLFKVSLLKRSKFSEMLAHHNLYTWYITAFWYNHLESLIASVFLLLYGVFTTNKEAQIHALFLFGHLANVKGYPQLGIRLVVHAFEKRETIRPWLATPFLSYMAYGLYMVGYDESQISRVLKEASLSLEKYPDPFYQILHYLCILRFASQIGDIEISEDIATKLIQFSEATKSQRFYFSAKADLALCYGVRGLYWRCDEILKDLESFNEAGVDPVEVASFYRLRGWAYFFVGKYESSFDDANKALLNFAKSKSFFMAQSMSEILRFISLFRLNLNKCKNVNESIKLTSSHIDQINKLKNKFAKHSVLTRILTEEEALLSASFGRFWQPGFSRDANVVFCQRRLNLVLNQVTLAPTDDSAWSIITNEIASSLSIQFDSRNVLKGKPDFEVRGTAGEVFGYELVIDRTVSNEQRFELIRFRLTKRDSSASVLDALHTLLPTFNCLFKIRDQQSFVLSAERSKTFNLVATQVAHDIRSPLAALNMASESFPDMPEEKRAIIRNAFYRINDIANQLLAKVRQSNVDQKDSLGCFRNSELLASTIEALISEKRIQFRDFPRIEISANLQNSYGLFAQISPTELKNILSNLINNSVEALKHGSGVITVGLEPFNDFVRLFVQDNGKGIPPHILANLGSFGVSYGKDGTSSGNGLGIFYAKRTVENLGGHLLIESTLGAGTRVSLNLLKAEVPKWFASSMSLSKSTKIICVDDDPSFHSIWKSKFESYGFIKDQNIFHFLSGQSFENWLDQNHYERESLLFLLDFDLTDCSESGLDLIERLSIAEQSVLVTSRFEDEEIQNRCIQLGVKIIPKSLAHFVSLELQTSEMQCDACLIDDDPLVRATWEMAAKGAGISVLTFESFEQFLLKEQSLGKETPISIDMNLSGGVRGTDIALKVSKLGFSSIYLSTGLEPEDLDHVPPCIKEIRGKEPRFFRKKPLIEQNL